MVFIWVSGEQRYILLIVELRSVASIDVLLPFTASRRHFDRTVHRLTAHSLWVMKLGPHSRNFLGKS